MRRTPLLVLPVLLACSDAGSTTGGGTVRLDLPAELWAAIKIGDSDWRPAASGDVEVGPDGRYALAYQDLRGGLGVRYLTRDESPGFRLDRDVLARVQPARLRGFVTGTATTSWVIVGRDGDSSGVSPDRRGELGYEASAVVGRQDVFVIERPIGRPARGLQIFRDVDVASGEKPHRYDLHLDAAAPLRLETARVVGADMAQAMLETEHGRLRLGDADALGVAPAVLSWSSAPGSVRPGDRYTLSALRLSDPGTVTHVVDAADTTALPVLDASVVPPFPVIAEVGAELSLQGLDFHGSRPELDTVVYRGTAVLVGTWPIQFALTAGWLAGETEFTLETPSEVWGASIGWSAEVNGWEVVAAASSGSFEAALEGRTGEAGTVEESAFRSTHFP